MSDRSTFNPIEPPEPPTPQPRPQLSPTLGDPQAALFVAPGREFGEYDQLKEIARGGMGVVFEAHQRKLERKVALKMILAGQLARPADVERFQAEARAAAALDHPNIVPIYEIGEHGGQHYFTMKLIEGGSLQAQLERLRADVRTAVRLMAVVARAVHFAHEKGVLHRDLKPGNVLIEQRGEELVPHLTDFGLAKVLSEASLTASGAIVGTPAYMPPEQASGGAKPISARSDVYSLGAMLYEILTGRPPFQAPTPMEVLLKVMSDEPAPPRALDRNVNRDLETITLKCLHKEPERRYESAQALAEDLKRWLKGEPIVARPMTRGERARRWARRHPGRVLLLLGVLLVGLWGAYAASDAWQRHQQRVIERQVEQAEKSREYGEKLCEQGKIDQGKIDEGLLWLARALEQSPPSASEQQERIRDVIAGWLRVRGGRDVLPGAEVDEVVVSPDGRTVATVTREKVARLYDAETGKPLGRTIWHPQSVWTVGFRKKDGKLIEAVLPGGGGSLFAPIAAKRATVPPKVLELSPDGELLLTQEGEKTLRMYRVSDGQPVGEPMVEQERITAAHFSPDGGAVVSWSGAPADFRVVPGDRFVRVWEASTGQARTKPLVTILSWGDSSLISSDGAFLARLLPSGAVELIEVRTGKALAELEQGNAPKAPRSLPVFSPVGHTLVCLRRDWDFEVWDLKQPRKPPRLVRTPGNYSHAEFSRDGQTLLVVDGNKGVACWHVRDWTAVGKPLRPPGERANRPPILTPDGKGVLIPFSKPKTVLVLYDVETRAKRIEFDLSEIQREGWWWSELSSDGKRLVVSSQARIAVYDVATGKRIGDPISNPIGSPTLSPDGKQLLLRRRRDVVSLWDVTSGQRLGEPALEKWLGDVPLFAPKGDWVVWRTHRNLRLYNVKDGRDSSLDVPEGQGAFPASRFRPLSRSRHQFSPDGHWLLTSSGWLVEPDRPQARQLLDDKTILHDGGFLRGGGQILTCYTGAEGVEIVTTVRLWEPNTAKDVGRREENASTQVLAFPSAGDRWFTLSGRAITCYQGASKDPIWNFNVPGKPIDLAITPDDRTLIVLLEEDGVILLDPADGSRRGNSLPYDNTWGRKPISIPFPHSGMVVFSPDGRFVATAMLGAPRVGDRAALGLRLLELLVCFQIDDLPLPVRPHVTGLVQVWDAQTGRAVGEALKHPRAVVAVAYSPDGKLLAAGCEDGSVRLWDAASGRQLGPALPHDGPVLRLAFDPQGKTLWASAVLNPQQRLSSHPAQHRVWNVSPPRDGSPQRHGSPQRIRIWLEIQTRRTLDGGTVRDLSNAELKKRQEALDRLGGPPS